MSTSLGDLKYSIVALSLLVLQILLCHHLLIHQSQSLPDEKFVVLDLCIRLGLQIRETRLDQSPMSLLCGTLLIHRSTVKVAPERRNPLAVCSSATIVRVQRYHLWSSRCLSRCRHWSMLKYKVVARNTRTAMLRLRLPASSSPPLGTRIDSYWWVGRWWTNPLRSEEWDNHRKGQHISCNARKETVPVAYLYPLANHTKPCFPLQVCSACRDYMQPMHTRTWTGNGNEPRGVWLGSLA